MKKLFLLLMTILIAAVSAGAQTRTVKGIVMSGEDDEPIVGAPVIVVGTKLGVNTDVNGLFIINNVPADAKMIRVSYVGMETVDVPITYGDMNIVLRTNKQLLDEVVVTAMGISRSEKSLGYSATQVSGADIEQAQTNNAMQALQGKVAGLQIQETGSAPGAAPNVNIRGLGSINGSNQPLYIVDGVPIQTSTFSSADNGSAVATGGVTNIAPDDIAAMTVLKGAAATSLYGSRAANGVIIITTKNGSANSGKNYSITYSGNVEASRVSTLPEFQNKWGQGWNGNQTFIENGSWGPALDGSRQVYGPVWNHQQLIHDYSAKKNNVRDFFDTGWSQKHNISLSGVSKNREMTYYVSYGFTGTDGVIPTDQDSYRRNTISMRGTYQPADWIKVSSSMNFANYRTKTVGQYQGTSVIDGVLEMARDISIVDMKDLSSPFNTPEAYFTPYGITNPYWALENNVFETNGKQVFGKMQVDIMPVKNVTLTYRAGIDYSDYDNKIGVPQIALDDALINNDYGYAPSNMNQDGYVQTYYRRSHEINHDIMANYADNFLDSRLSVNATVGMNINERYATAMSGQADKFAINTGFWQLGNGSAWTSLYETQSKRRMLGAFAYLSLGWDEFAFIDITGRNDWSSTLPKDNRSFFYPGITGSFIFTRWIPNKDILSFGKVRIAYGKTGNDASPYYTSTNYVQAYTDGYYVLDIIKFPFHSVNAFMASATAGSNTLKPEMTSEFEIGTNLRFFNGRIDLDATYYNRETSDQIFSLPIDPSTGYSRQVINFGTVRNRGVELMVNTIPVRTSDFQWELGFNFAKNYNKVLSLPEGLDGGKTSIYSFSAGNDAVYMYAEEGKPLGEFYTYLPQYVTDRNSPDFGKPIVDSAGQPVLGSQIEDTGFNMNNKWTGGITTAITYKGVTLSAALDIRYGGKMFSRTKNLMQFTGNGKVTEYNERRPFVIPNSVVDNGDGTYSPNTTPIYLSNGSYQTYFNEYGWGNGGLAYLLDRSYAKLRNISLTWSIPAKWLQQLYLSEVAITAYCNNAFTWTARDNRYVDPESTTVAGYGDLAYGFGELYSNPSNRTFGLNLKVKF